MSEVICLYAFCLFSLISLIVGIIAIKIERRNFKKEIKKLNEKLMAESQINKN